jgi:hypothetical protein
MYRLRGGHEHPADDQKDAMMDTLSRDTHDHTKVVLERTRCTSPPVVVADEEAGINNMGGGIHVATERHVSDAHEIRSGRQDDNMNSSSSLRKGKYVAHNF